MPGIHGEVWLHRSGLTLVGVIDTVWRTDIAVFGVCDAAKWCQCFRGVPMPPSGANACGTLDWGRDPALRTPKYGHLLPTRRPRATMAT